MSIIPVGTKGRTDIKIELYEISRTETRILVGIALGSESNPEAMEVAQRVSGNEMYVLRQAGFEMPEGFKPEAIEQQIDGKTFRVTTYVFTMAEWKRKTMKGWFEGKEA